MTCLCCGGRTRTCDLQVMSLASYQLLHSAMLTMFRISFLNCVCKGTSFLSYNQTFAAFFHLMYEKSTGMTTERLFFHAGMVYLDCGKPDGNCPGNVCGTKGLQEVAFWLVICRLLHAKRRHITSQKDRYWKGEVI